MLNKKNDVFHNRVILACALFVLLALIVFNAAVALFARTGRELLVWTYCRNASAAQVEEQVSIPIEKQLKLINGVKDIECVSTLEYSTITLRLNGRDTERLVRECLANMRFPEGARPQLMDFSNDAFIRSAFTGANYNTLREYVAAAIKPNIEAIKGVREVRILGGMQKEITAQPHSSQLSAQGMTLDMFVEQLNESAELLDVGRESFIADSEQADIERFKNLLIDTPNGRLPLSALSTVKETYTDVGDMARVNTQPYVIMEIIMDEGRNPFAFSHQVNGELMRLQGIAEDGLEVYKLLDRSEELLRGILYSALKVLAAVLLTAILLALVLLALFGRRLWKSFKQLLHSLFIKKLLPLSLALALLIGGVSALATAAADQITDFTNNGVAVIDIDFPAEAGQEDMIQLLTGIEDELYALMAQECPQILCTYSLLRQGSQPWQRQGARGEVAVVFADILYSELSRIIDQRMAARAGISYQIKRQDKLFEPIQDINLIVRGADWQMAADLAQAAMLELEKIEGVSGLKSDLSINAHEADIKIDYAVLAAYGLTEASFNQAVNAATGGIMTDAGIRVTAPHASELSRIVITAHDGVQAPITDLAEISYQKAPGKLVRKNGNYEIAVSGKLSSAFLRDTIASVASGLFLYEGYAVNADQRPLLSAQLIGCVIGGAILVAGIVYVSLRLRTYVLRVMRKRKLRKPIVKADKKS